jgi:hypothetical protein
VARSGKDEPLLAREMVHDLPHTFGRRDMVLAAGLDVGRRLHPVDVDRGSRNLDAAFLSELVRLV